MDIQKRLIGPCSSYSRDNDDVQVDFGSLVRRLILFDAYILQSTRLKEIPHMVETFRCEGVQALLSSGVLSIHCDATTPGQTGQTTTLKSRIKKGVLPLGSFSFSIIKPHDRKKYISDCLQGVHKTKGISFKETKKLKQTVVSALENIPDNSGFGAINQLKKDIIDNSPMIKLITVKVLHKRFGINTKPEEFLLKLHPIDDDDFQSETNIGSLFKLEEPEVHKIIEKALLTLAGLNLRTEEMSAYSALSGFIDNELPIFGEKLNFLAKLLSPMAVEERMQRVIELKGLPDIDAKDYSIRVDIEKLLKIRDSYECREFRNWLSTIDEATDKEILERINSIRSKIMPIFYGKKARLIRLFVNTGIGLSFGPIGGLGAGAIDTFLLKKILPYKGAIAFINKLYPSIFKDS